MKKIMKKRFYPTLVVRTCILALPIAALFLLCYIVPFVMTAWYSFHASSFDSTFIGLTNYFHVWSNGYFRLALENTLRLTCLLVMTSGVAALGLGYLLHAIPSMVGAGIMVFMLPLFLPSASVATVWRAVFQTSAFSSAGTALTAILTLFLWKYAGVGAVLIKIGLDNVPKDALSAADLDGAGRFRKFWSISLPCIRGEITLSLLFFLLFAFRIYKESYLLFGEYPCDSMYLIQHYMSNHFAKLNFQYVSAAAASLAAIALCFYAAAYLLMKRRRRDSL
jgi:multiple sugar transport system permease protein